jgi:hypothetical protein
MRNLTVLEDRITGKERYEKAKLAIRVEISAAKTAGAIAACGTGIAFPVALALSKAVYDDIELLIDIYTKTKFWMS